MDIDSSLLSEEEFVGRYVKESDFSYHLCRYLLLPLFWLIYHPKVFGKENIPRSGPVILACNHRNMVDPGFVAFSSTRTMHFLAKKELHDGIMGFFFRLAQTIPVDRSRHNHAVIEAGLEVLKKEQALVIFPEGTRNRTEEPLLPLKFGAVSLASQSHAAVVPIAIKSNYIPFFGKSAVMFGEPYQIDSDTDLQKANAVLREKMIDLQEKLL